MRWKLLFVAPLLAAAAAVGAVFLLERLLGFSHGSPVTLLYIAVPPLAAAMGAAVFVYRHTARRRKLQAALTVLFALVLTVAALFASRMFLNL